MKNEDVKHWESYQRSVARRAERARNVKRECLICKRQEYLDNAALVDNLTYLSSTAKVKKRNYWLGLANRKLKDIQTTPHIDTIWACGVEHYARAKEMMEDYLTGFKRVEINREKERAEWKLKRIHLVDFMYFITEVWGRDETKFPSVTEVFTKYADRISFELQNMDERYNTELSKFTGVE